MSTREPDLTSRSPRLIDAVLWGAAVIWATATAVWTLGPTPPETGSFPQVDKVLHALAYGVMVLLLALAADRRPGRGPGPLPGSAIWLAVLAFAAAGVLELLQRYTDRETELLDWVAGGVGVAIGWSAWAWINRRWATTRQPVPPAGSDQP